MAASRNPGRRQYAGFPKWTDNISSTKQDGRKGESKFFKDGGLSKDQVWLLKNEILMAETINREEIEPIMVESLQRYMGKHTPKYGYNWDIILNEVYPIVQTNLPAIFFRTPRAFLKPRNRTYIQNVFDPASGKKVPTEMDSQKSANTQEAILNYSLERIKYKRETRKCLLDALLFPHGVLWHGFKGDYGMTEEQSIFIKDEMIFVKRICPTRFLKDPKVNFSNIDEANWVGRKFQMLLSDLIDDDKLNVDNKLIKGYKGYGDKVGTASLNAAGIMGVQSIQTGGGDTTPLLGMKKNLLDFTKDGFSESPYANFVDVYEVFIRATRKEQREGKKGRIVLLTFEQPELLRDNKWEVKASGFPVQLLQFNELPDAMVGICDVDTYKSVADQKNIIVNLQLRNAQENSKLYVALATGGLQGEESISKVQSGDQTIILFEGDSVAGKMDVKSGAGAASSELYLIDQRIQKNLDDKSGVTDLRKGVLQSGEESALSVKIRNANSSARPAYRQDIMKDFLQDSFLYLVELLKQYMPIDEAVRIVGSMDLQWSDKPTEEEVQADVDVEIDAISMLPENPEDEVAMLQQALSMMVEALTQPVIMEKIQQEGYTIGLVPLIQQLLQRMKLKDPDMFRSIKPEESQGYASVQQLKFAQANVEAIMHGQPPQPPQPGDDHQAQIAVYQPIAQLLQEAGQQQTQAFQVLMQVIQIQTQMMQDEQEKQANPGQQLRPKKPVTVAMGK
jgi:hypothetical protein